MLLKNTFTSNTNTEEMNNIDNNDWTDHISNVHIEVKYYFIPEEANG